MRATFLSPASSVNAEAPTATTSRGGLLKFAPSQEQEEQCERLQEISLVGHLMEDKRNGLLTAEGQFLPLQCRVEKPKNPWSHWA